jgi:hypothetical protein
MRTCALAIGFAISVVFTVGLPSGTAHAQKAAKGKCAGGMAACIERCSKRGGQPRLCPAYCTKTHGC